MKVYSIVIIVALLLFALAVFMHAVVWPPKPRSSTVPDESRTLEFQQRNVPALDSQADISPAPTRVRKSPEGMTSDDVRRAGEMADYDNDGVPNATDNCIFVANVDQLDSDGDLIGDSCESD